MGDVHQLFRYIPWIYTKSCLHVQFYCEFCTFHFLHVDRMRLLSGALPPSISTDPHSYLENVEMSKSARSEKIQESGCFRDPDRCTDALESRVSETHSVVLADRPSSALTHHYLSDPPLKAQCTNGSSRASHLAVCAPNLEPGNLNGEVGERIFRSNGESFLLQPESRGDAHSLVTIPLPTSHSIAHCVHSSVD